MSLSRALRLLDAEDTRMLAAVRRTGPALSRAVGLIAERLSAGGRLFIAGAGTSGRLGVLEAAECPPTFGTPPSLVQAFMAGGASSVFRSREGAEDKGASASALVRKKVRREDVVIGVTASGVTAFAITALKAARRKGAAAILVTCNPAAPRGAADIVIAADSGAEVIAGSTRMKAGTATKMVLNMLSTGSMIRLGKTYGNLMVDLRASNSKLADRAQRIVRDITKLSAAETERLLNECGGEVKTAIVRHDRGVSAAEARQLLLASQGHLRKALERSTAENGDVR
jgi:N-acetylmuramic acid 6-phosphate etherase